MCHDNEARGRGHRVRVEINGEEVDERVRRVVERAERHVEKNVKPHLKHLRRHMREMDIQGIVDSAMAQAGAWAQAQPATPAERPASYAEERMTILRMVQEGKITAEEAARLLQALE